MIDQTLGNYRVTKKLGEGGMGIVYQAEHVSIGRKVAIKLLRPMFSDHPEIVTRFFNEARATSLIEHPGLINVFDYGFHEKSAYIVMEFIAGESLATRLAREGSLSQDLVVGIARQVAGALQAAHERQIVHRDLKPDNIMLVADADIPIGLRAKVLDFGIAKLAADPNGSDMRTRTGAIMGTPAFMSPEQCRGAGEVDARSDIYALGCIMFMMATGNMPFLGEGYGEILVAHMRDPIPEITTPRISAQLASIIRAMLAKTVNERPQTMAAVVSLLDDLSPHRIRASSPIAHLVTQPKQLATTLSGSSGIIDHPPPPPRSSYKFAATIGGLATLATLGTVVVVTSKSDRGAVVTSAPTVAAPPVASPPATTAITAREAPVAVVAPSASRKLHVETTPSGATMTVVDGTERHDLGRTPGDIDVPARDVQIELALPGYAPRIEAIKATDAAPSLSVALGADKLRATISSAPAGAIVFDSTQHRRGKTPFRVDLERGEPARSYRIVCAGFKDQVVEISAKRPAASIKLARDLNVPPASECD